MKKKHSKSVAAVGNVGQTTDYVVGLVSASLSKEQPQAASGALSSIFSAASSNTMVFVPAPKPEPKVDPVRQQETHVQQSSKGAQIQKSMKVKSKAEKHLQTREQTLATADEEDVEKSRKKVKRKKAPQIDDEDELEAWRPSKRQKTAPNMAEERIKLKRTVFVGNLPTNFKKKNLIKIFKDLGAIESVRFRSVVREDPTMSRRLATIRRQVDPKKPSINAYVVFKEEEGAVNALQRNGMEVEKDHHIRVDRVSKHHSPDHKRSIFVGNLPYDIMEQPLWQHFEECGKVEAVRLVRDRNTGVGKGFGYVLFENTDAVMLALKLNGSQLLDRKIRVKRSVKKEKVKKVVVKKEKVKNSRGPAGWTGKRQSQGPAGQRGPWQGQPKGSRQNQSNRAPRKPFKKSSAPNKTSFTGEVADAHAKKGKGLKKRFQPKKKGKTVHI